MFGLKINHLATLSVTRNRMDYKYEIIIFILPGAKHSKFFSAGNVDYVIYDVIYYNICNLLQYM
jgi:hypothetical protein